MASSKNLDAGETIKSQEEKKPEMDEEKRDAQPENDSKDSIDATHDATVLLQMFQQEALASGRSFAFIPAGSQASTASGSSGPARAQILGGGGGETSVHEALAAWAAMGLAEAKAAARHVRRRKRQQ